MSDVNVQVNPQASLVVLAAGEEKTPVVVIDDFARDTGDIIRYATDSAEFTPDGSFYPGARARAPGAYRQEIIRAIAPLLGKLYSVPRDRRLNVKAYYSLVSTPPEKLQAIQRIPHCDSHSKYYFAVTHYLNPGEFGGTGLYRHRPTGFEKITEDRVDEYQSTSDAFVSERGEPPLEYFTQSTDHFEFLLGIDYRPNRLVAYPGSLLHSGLIDPQRDISSDPATGRLTANFFLDFQPPAREIGDLSFNLD